MTKPLKPAERAKLAGAYCTHPAYGQKPKRGYASKAEAKRAMKAVNRTRHGEGRERGVYLCACGSWHLTKQRPDDGTDSTPWKARQREREASRLMPPRAASQ